MTDFIVRELRVEDLEKGFFETLANLIPVGDLSTERARGIFDELSSNSVYTVFVAELEGQIVGAATLLIEQKFLFNGGRMAHIEDVATRKGYERRGIGKALQNAAAQKAIAMGCFRIDLCCEKENIPFYEQCGFVVSEYSMQRHIIHIPPKQDG